MRRRDFIKAIAGSSVAWSLTADAQQRKMLVIGYLNTRAPSEDTNIVAAFRQGLTETGYVEGRNVAMDYRFAEGHNDRLPALGQIWFAAASP